MDGKISQMNEILDDLNIRSLPPQGRFDKLSYILKNSDDESLRVDSVWLLSEMGDSVKVSDPLYEKIADMLVWVLQNDKNGVVKHEAAYEIGRQNMINKIPDLLRAAVHDDNVLVRHESVEALGLMKTDEFKEKVKVCLKDTTKEVRESAMFVLKRIERRKNNQNPPMTKSQIDQKTSS
jgi:HEAT repeat protein